MSNYEIRTDLGKNRLYLSLDGFLSDDQVSDAVSKIVNEVDKLKPGFAVINDISNFKPASAQAAEEIKKAQVYVKEKGVGRVIRITGDAGLAAMQLNRTSRSSGYAGEEAESVAAAERMLDAA